MVLDASRYKIDSRLSVEKYNSKNEFQSFFYHENMNELYSIKLTKAMDVGSYKSGAHTILATTDNSAS